MASRAELVQIMQELELDFHNKSIKEMSDEIKKEIDRRYSKKGFYSADNLSDTLKKFVTNEYDYAIEDKDGNRLKF